MVTNTPEQIWYIGKRPPVLCVVTPSSELASYAEDAARVMRIDTCIALSRVDNDVEVAMEMIHREKVKFLATRGYAAYILRKKTTISILSIAYASEDFLETLLPYQNTKAVIGHLCFPGQGYNFKKVAKLLGIQGHRLEIESRNAIQPALNKAREKNISLLVGGRGVIDKARSCGFNGIYISRNNKEVVFQTFSEAKYLIHIDGIRERETMMIRKTLELNPNIIIYANANYLIEYANKAAIRVFRDIKANITGCSLTELFPRLDSLSVFSEADSGETIIISDILDREFLLEYKKITVCSDAASLILSLTNVSDIHKQEIKIREKKSQHFPPASYTFGDIRGTSAPMQAVTKLAVKFARSDDPILLFGETGTGKELFAQAIHNSSNRKGYPFISINCASLSQDLLESELFGYEEGAFTSARRGGKTGLFELANKGTLFLDEVGEMNQKVQSRLLRVLQDNVLIRLGGIKALSVDVRIVCATNRNLYTMVKAGEFRQDLFYRINTLILHIPPLRERKEDIVPVALAYLEKKHKTISAAAIRKLQSHSWPGNVRELLHVIDRAAVISEHNVIEQTDIVFDNQIFATGDTQTSTPEACPNEYHELIRILEKNQYHRGKTAADLGISRATLWKKMKAFNIG